MAESAGVSGILGTDGESPAEGALPETGLDATAAALAAEAARGDPELAREASAYFRKQSHLVEIQTEHLHEQRAVNLQLLKLRRFGERLKVGLQLFVILVATVIGIGVAVHDPRCAHLASRRHRAVRFPELHWPRVASTGKVVAAGLLGELNRLQAATKSSAAKRDLTNAWSAERRAGAARSGHLDRRTLAPAQAAVRARRAYRRRFGSNRQPAISN